MKEVSNDDGPCLQSLLEPVKCQNIRVGRGTCLVAQLPKISPLTSLAVGVYKPVTKSIEDNRHFLEHVVFHLGTNDISSDTYFNETCRSFDRLVTVLKPLQVQVIIILTFAFIKNQMRFVSDRIRLHMDRYLNLRLYTLRRIYI